MAGKSSIINDLGILTKLPNKVLETLITKINLCIGSAISEAIKEQATAITLNIGIGTLSIELASMQCKFVPSKELKNTIKACINSGADPLEIELEQELYDKLMSICDEVI